MPANVNGGIEGVPGVPRVDVGRFKVAMRG